MGENNDNTILAKFRVNFNGFLILLRYKHTKVQMEIIKPQPL